LAQALAQEEPAAGGRGACARRRGARVACAATMAAVGLDNYRVKDAMEWSAVDVREFLMTILPGHPCVDFFTYTTGYVLCSLDKEDLRRQARDEEAANVIWAELKGRSRAVAAATAAAPGSGGQLEAHQERGGVEGPPTVTVYVRTRQEVAVELEVVPSDTVSSMKAQIAEIEGTPVECQRLIFSGMNMQDDRSLSSYALRRGAVVLLVPQVRDQGKMRPQMFAPRGKLKGRQPTQLGRPYMPVVCSDASRSFPVCLEFGSPADCEAFVSAASQEPPVLQIQPAKRGQLPAETRVHLDPDTEGVTLESTGNILTPSTRYVGTLFLGGRGGEVDVAVVTGADVS